MSQPHPLLKIAALASSILLVGGLVCYRANAFHFKWRAGTTPAGAISGDNLTFDKDPFEGSPTESPFNGVVFEFSTTGGPDPNSLTIPSPKSGPVFLPPAPAATESGSTYLSSSKGGVVFPPPAPARSTSDATIMSSSKSIILTPPPAQAAANGPAQGQSPSAARSR